MTNKILTPVVLAALAACSGTGGAAGSSPSLLPHSASGRAAVSSKPSIVEFNVGIPTSTSIVIGITTGSDGALYFSEAGAERIGRITTTGVLSSFALAGKSRTPYFEAAGSDGNLWITLGANKSNTEAIGRLTHAGLLTVFPLPAPLASLPVDEAGPRHIVSGPDGNLWFVERSGYVGRMTPSGVLTRFPTPTPLSFLSGITVGPDGALWFTESLVDKIGRITTSGAITEYSSPSSFTGTAGIATGPDGNLWFAELFTDKVGRITPAGVVTEFAVTPGSGPGSSTLRILVELPLLESSPTFRRPARIVSRGTSFWDLTRASGSRNLGSTRSASYRSRRSLKTKTP